MIRYTLLIAALIGPAACQSSNSAKAKKEPLYTPTLSSKRGAIVQTDGGRVEVLETVSQDNKRAKLFQVDEADQRIRFTVNVDDLSFAFEEVTGCQLPDSVRLFHPKDLEGADSIEVPVNC